jgi:hypothetical protein
MDDKDKYIKNLEAANERLRNQLDDYEQRFVSQLDSLGIGKNIDMQTFCNLIDVNCLVKFLKISNEWEHIETRRSNDMDWNTFRFKEEKGDHRVSFFTDSVETSYLIEYNIKSFKTFWDIWTKCTGGKRNISLLLNILEFKYNQDKENNICQKSIVKRNTI